MRQGLAALLDRTGADELLAAAAIHDHPARLRSYELLAEAASALAPQRLAA